mmetsp:Transcript_1798/g.5909  ORF Transcript_1798/g.5909 Transcript_1798/m.5909 type:complete len:225 (+) Transcript_1798:3101-3775(+)
MEPLRLRRRRHLHHRLRDHHVVGREDVVSVPAARVSHRARVATHQTREGPARVAADAHLLAPGARKRRERSVPVLLHLRRHGHEPVRVHQTAGIHHQLCEFRGLPQLDALAVPNVHGGIVERHHARLHDRRFVRRDSHRVRRRDVLRLGRLAAELDDGEHGLRRPMHAQSGAHDFLLFVVHPDVRVRHAQPRHRGDLGQLRVVLAKGRAPRERRRPRLVLHRVG